MTLNEFLQYLTQNGCSVKVDGDFFYPLRNITLTERIIFKCGKQGCSMLMK